MVNVNDVILSMELNNLLHFLQIPQKFWGGRGFTLKLKFGIYSIWIWFHLVTSKKARLQKVLSNMALGLVQWGYSELPMPKGTLLPQQRVHNSSKNYNRTCGPTNPEMKQGQNSLNFTRVKGWISVMNLSMNIPWYVIFLFSCRHCIFYLDIWDKWWLIQGPRILWANHNSFDLYCTCNHQLPTTGDQNLPVSYWGDPHTWPRGDSWGTQSGSCSCRSSLGRRSRTACTPRSGSSRCTRQKLEVSAKENFRITRGRSKIFIWKMAQKIMWAHSHYECKVPYTEALGFRCSLMLSKLYFEAFWYKIIVYLFFFFFFFGGGFDPPLSFVAG